MMHFSLTDLSNRSGEVVEAAFRGPVEIRRRGKRKFVLLTAENYDQLVRAVTGLIGHAIAAQRSRLITSADFRYFLVRVLTSRGSQSTAPIRSEMASRSGGCLRRGLFAAVKRSRTISHFDSFLRRDSASI
jgi:prevent-host-death family protein